MTLLDKISQLQDCYTRMTFLLGKVILKDRNIINNFSNANVRRMSANPFLLLRQFTEYEVKDEKDDVIKELEAKSNIVREFQKNIARLSFTKDELVEMCNNKNYHKFFISINKDEYKGELYGDLELVRLKAKEDNKSYKVYHCKKSNTYYISGANEDYDNNTIDKVYISIKI